MNVYMNKKVISVAMASIMMVSAVNIAFAQEDTWGSIQVEPINNEFEVSGRISDIDTVSTKNMVTIDDISIPFYPTFDNPDLAIENIVEQNKDFLKVLEKQYNLGPLNPDNWDKYREACYNYEVDLTADSQYMDSYWSLLSFFDIYENEDKNDEIIELINNINAGDRYSRQSNDELYRELYFALPYNEELTETMRERVAKIDNDIMTAASRYSVSKGVEYAEKYAVNYNPKYYDYSSDCTNFVSQIISYAGVPETSGWYWESATKNGCSRAWRIADYFCKEFGIDYKNGKSFDTYSNQLSKGDVITYDVTNDLDWDHLGYVVAMGSQLTDFGPLNLDFRDFKVAQHSNDYCKWASDTGWPRLKYDADVKCVYGVIYGDSL